EDDTVYDPFCGSGSTILASEANNRRGHGIEISPIYVDIICNRYQRHTDTKPILERTGKARNFVD
ncbi:MAG: DNA methyltransferase, partial [Ilumatobacteraceae bacterium]